MSKAIVIGIWALIAIVVILLITLPISLQAHLVAGTVALAAMIVLKLLRAEGVWRLIALAFGTAIVLRYVYWRTTSTLPPVDQLENFIPGLLLYLAEMYSVGMLALSLFVVVDAAAAPHRTGDPGGPLPDRRRLRAELQRGCAAASPRRSPRRGRWTIRPTS